MGKQAKRDDVEAEIEVTGVEGDETDQEADDSDDDGSVVINLDDQETILDDEEESDNIEGIVTESEVPDEKLRNRINAQARIAHKQKQEAEQRKANPPKAAPVKTVTQVTTPSPAPIVKPAPLLPQGYDPNNPRTWSPEQWDALAEKDWQLAVKLKTRIEAEDVVQNQQVRQAQVTRLEESKRIVLARHPELDKDEHHEKTQIYLQILNENPSYLEDPKGPIHAMRDMEERMRELGYAESDIVNAENRGVKRERERTSRVTLSSTRGRTPISTGRQVTLSRDDMEFCKVNGINPRDYAANKLRLSGSKKIEV